MTATYLHASTDQLLLLYIHGYARDGALRLDNTNVNYCHAILRS